MAGPRAIAANVAEGWWQPSSWLDGSARPALEIRARLDTLKYQSKAL
jgi:hypothetical protein